MPAVAGGIEKSGDQNKQEEKGHNGKPCRRRRNAFLGFGGSCGQMIGAGKIVFAEESFLVEAQIRRDGTYEPGAKDTAGQPAPIFILECFDKTGANARGLSKFFNGNFAQFALALQAVTKISPGHEPEPVLDKSAGALGLEHPDPVRAIGRRRGIPERTIGGGIQCCQTERKVGRERLTAGSGEKNRGRVFEGDRRGNAECAEKEAGRSARCSPHVFLRKSAEAIENNRVDFLVSLRVLGPLVLTRTMIALASE